MKAAWSASTFRPWCLPNKSASRSRRRCSGLAGAFAHQNQAAGHTGLAHHHSAGAGVPRRTHPPLSGSTLARWWSRTLPSAHAARAVHAVGAATPPAKQGIRTESTRCRMEHNLFIRDSLRLGYLTSSNTAWMAKQIGPLRFSRLLQPALWCQCQYEHWQERTAPQCKESLADSHACPCGRW